MTDHASAEARLGRAVRRDPLLAALARDAGAEGWSVHVVGGWLRDHLLGRTARDVDIVLGPRPAAALDWLSKRSSHRTVTFDRRLVNHRLTIDGRHVDIVERGTRRIEEELARRDFTVNALGYDLVGRRLHDPCGGLADLAAGRLVLPRDDAIRRDPLRALRGVRLEAEIDALALTNRTRRRLAPDAEGLAGVAPERVRDELERVLESGEPAAGIRTADDCGLLTVWLPELGAMRGVTQGPPHHLDVYEHSLAALALAGRPGRLARGLLPRGWPPADEEDTRRVLLWSILLHDVGKPATREVRDDGRISFHGHESEGAAMADAICRRLALPGRVRRAIRTVVALHLRLVVPPAGDLSPRALGRIVRAAGPLLEVLCVHSLADQGAARAGGYRRVRAGLRRTIALVLERRDEMRRAAERGRLLTGRDVIDRLGISEGPRIGELLREAESLRDEGRIVSREDALAWLDGHRVNRADSADRRDRPDA